jgi:hypothetical protein
MPAAGVVRIGALVVWFFPEATGQCLLGAQKTFKYQTIPLETTI